MFKLLLNFELLQEFLITRKGNRIMKPIDIEQIYNDHLERQGAKELETIRKTMPETNEYSASSSGMCSRKIYYKAIEKAERTEEIDNKTRRIFRVGSLIHKDLQDALLDCKRKEPKENI